jgi:peptidoglycan/xylan/chitin deacetylase (PgdA/CDA1 family)
MTGILGLSRVRAVMAPFAKSVLLRSGALSAIRRLFPSRQLAILRYHAICGPEGHAYASPGICVTPESFERHVAYLTRAYAVVPLQDAVRRLISGSPLPPNAVAITFDDGYADNLGAARTLAKYGATATFYVTAGCLEGGEPFWPAEIRYLVHAATAERIVLSGASVRLELKLQSPGERAAAIRRLTCVIKSHPIEVRERIREQLRSRAGSSVMPRVMLTWDELREMHRLGMTIGSHTMTHPNLPSAGLAAAARELVDSRRRLQNEINAPVTMFSYPNGGAERYYSRELMASVRDAGYTAAVTSRNALASHASDPYALERVRVQDQLSHLLFALEVERFVFRNGRERLDERRDQA